MSDEQSNEVSAAKEAIERDVAELEACLEKQSTEIALTNIKSMSQLAEQAKKVEPTTNATDISNINKGSLTQT